MPCDSASQKALQCLGQRRPLDTQSVKGTSSEDLLRSHHDVLHVHWPRPRPTSDILRDQRVDLQPALMSGGAIEANPG